jgi:hypothetical protein
MEAVDEGLLQIHGIAPNSKQEGISRLMCENANRFIKISGNNKIAKALDIKEDLGIDCLMYCEHCLNLQHRENKNDFKKKFSWRLHGPLSLPTIYMKGSMQGKCRRAGQALCASVMPQDTSRRWGKTRKDLAVGVGYCLGGQTDTTPV